MSDHKQALAREILVAIQKALSDLPETLPLRDVSVRESELFTTREVELAFGKNGYLSLRLFQQKPEAKP